MAAKKVMIVRTALGQGGADRVTVNVLRYLDRHRYEPMLVLMRPEGEFINKIPSDIKIVTTKSKNLWFFLPALFRCIVREKPEVVFSIDGGVNIPLSIIAFASPYRKWKAILSERNIVYPPGKSKIKRMFMLWLKRFFYRFADVLTAVSEGVQEDMHQQLKTAKESILVVHNPMVEPVMLLQAKEHVEHPWFQANRTEPVIVHAGRFVHQKDHKTLVRAFALLRKQLPCKLFLLGEGPLLSSIKTLVNELGIVQDVYFAGFDINPFKYFSRCDLFVLSSLHEGMPGVLIQAMACGAAVVSTDCPSGPNEIINADGTNGLLVPVADVSALSQAMVTVLSDTSFKNNLRQHAARSVEKFSVAKAIQSYEKAIDV